MEMEEDNRRSVWNNNKDLLHLPPSVALLKGNWFSFYRMRLEQISYLPPSVALLKGNWFTFYRMRLEQISYYPVQIYLAYYHFSLWWWVFLVPQSCAKFSLITMNMLQHDGCLVLRELGQTPDPYIAEGSQTVQEVDFAQMATEAEEIQRKVAAAAANGGVFDPTKTIDASQEELIESKFKLLDEHKIRLQTDSSSTSVASEVSTHAGDDDSGHEPPQSLRHRLAPTGVVRQATEEAEVADGGIGQEKVVTEEDRVAQEKSSPKELCEEGESSCTRTSSTKLWDPDFNFSRDFTGPWINFFTCNNGYHTIHHMRPSMHWTKYPEQSRKLVEPHQHPELRQQNLFAYSFRTFFLNKRQTWDGRPYFPDEPNYDIPWVGVFFKRFDPMREN